MIRRISMTLAVLTIASLAFAGDHQHAAAPASPSFDKMKSLVGDWKAEIPGMGAATATYSLHSDGGALVEELKMHGENMVSVYYPTTDGVAMTHYCSGHNQPHMVSTGAGQDVSFAEVSVDNLSSKDAEHMKAVDFAFKDKDHFTATWTHTAGGKDAPVPFHFLRMK